MVKIHKEKGAAIPFHRIDVGVKEAAAIGEVLASGWINTGERAKRFEAALGLWVPAHEVIGVSSAWAGLFLTLRAFGVGAGDEVITTPFTFAATGNVILQCGATPVFVDIDKTHTLAPARLEAALSARTKAIIPVDLGGYPSHYTEILRVLAAMYPKHGKRTQVFTESGHDFQRHLQRPLVLVDAAHAFGTYPITGSGGGAQLGQLSEKRAKSEKIPAPPLDMAPSPAYYQGDVRVYSFHSVKNITTIDGGALAICHPRLCGDEVSVSVDADKSFGGGAAIRSGSSDKQPNAITSGKRLSFTKLLRALALHGMDKDAYKRYKEGKWWGGYDIVAAGYKTNLTDVSAAMGLVQLERWAEIAAKRAQVALYYESVLGENKYFCGRRDNVCCSYWDEWHIAPHLYTLELVNVATTGEELAALRNALLGELAAAGIGCNIHYVPLYKMSYYKRYFSSYDIKKAFPVTEAVAGRIFSLPFHSLLTEANVARITETIIRSSKNLLKKVGRKEGTGKT